jgi:hypothetical protein
MVSLKKLGYTDRKAADLITEWGFQIGRTSVNND